MIFCNIIKFDIIVIERIYLFLFYILVFMRFKFIYLLYIVSYLLDVYIKFDFE